LHLTDNNIPYRVWPIISLDSNYLKVYQIELNSKDKNGIWIQTNIVRRFFIR
jgi:hypothetical protein